MKRRFYTLYFAALKLKNNRKAQDLIEYALMAGFVAVAAGAIMPGVSNNITMIFQAVRSVLAKAALNS